MASIKLESENYFLRPLTSRDAETGWGEWLNDASTAAALNSVPRSLSGAEIAKYVEAMNNQTSYLFGVFEKATDHLVGVWTIYVDNRTREFLLNVLMSPLYGRNKGALTETREPLYKFFFIDLDLQAARANVMASNVYMLQRLKRQPWTLEHRSHTRAAGTQDAHAEVCHFRMTKAAWEEFHRAKAP